MNVVSTTFIHDDFIRKSILVNRLFEKGCCCLFITMLREHKINRITLLIKDSTQMAMSPLHVDF